MADGKGINEKHHTASETEFEWTLGNKKNSFC